MRKRLIVFGIIVLILGMSLPVYSGGIINKQNQSAEYVRSLTRNAATDSADAVAFNPAGVMRMQNGLYVKADVVYLDKEYSNDVPGFGNMESDEPSLVPGIFALYKQEKWAAFFAVTVPGGGGEVKYDDGNARTVALSLGTLVGVNAYMLDNFSMPNYLIGINSQYIEAESVYMGYTLGGAFKVNDWFSVAGGVRYVDGYQEFKGHAILNINPEYGGGANRYDVDLKRTADGWNYFLGFNVAPNDRLNIGFLYMSNTRLSFESDVDKDTVPNGATVALGWEDGTHEREDLPGYLALGVSYFIIPNKLRTEVDLTYYLENDATFDAERFDGAGNSYDLAVSLEYIFNPQWKVSVGYMYTNIRGMSPDDVLTEAPELDANSVALGCVWSPLDRLSFTLGGIRAWYDSETKEVTNGRGPAGTELDKDVWGLSFGLQYRFL
jgi:long-chain fatty acid transport protein